MVSGELSSAWRVTANWGVAVGLGKAVVTRVGVPEGYIAECSVSAVTISRTNSAAAKLRYVPIVALVMSAGVLFVVTEWTVRRGGNPEVAV
jgi:hypothetical protein